MCCNLIKLRREDGLCEGIDSSLKKLDCSVLIDAHVTFIICKGEFVRYDCKRSGHDSMTISYVAWWGDWNGVIMSESDYVMRRTHGGDRRG